MAQEVGGGAFLVIPILGSSRELVGNYHHLVPLPSSWAPAREEGGVGPTVEYVVSAGSGRFTGSGAVPKSSVWYTGNVQVQFRSLRKCISIERKHSSPKGVAFCFSVFLENVPVYSEARLNKPVDCVLFGVGGAWWFIASLGCTAPRRTP